MAETGTRNDPYRGYNFKLDIDGITEAHFTSCSGLGAKIQSIPYREAGAHQIVRQLPGPVQYGEVTLRYGLTASQDLWQWFMNAVQGTVERRSVSIVILGEDGGTEVMRWNLLDAWPCEWRGSLLDAMGREAAIETLTLVFERIERA